MDNKQNSNCESPLTFSRISSPNYLQFGFIKHLKAQRPKDQKFIIENVLQKSLELKNRVSPY